MPTRSDIDVVVLAGRPLTPALSRWLARFPAKNVRASQPPGSGGGEFLALWRNSIVADFLEHRHRPYLMMVDADAWPIPESEGIITAEADVCGVHAVGRHGARAHAGDGEVGAHCLRISRHALEAIAASDAFSAQRGWFAFPTTDRGTRVIVCEDGYFCWLARQAGFRPIKVAPMGHLLPIVVLPTDDPDVADYQFPSRALSADGVKAT